MKPVEQGFIDPQDPRYITYAGRRMLRVIGAEDPPEVPVVETPPAPEPVVETPPAPGPGPWAAELEARITDPAARAEADAYLREVWQPRVTQLEQAQTPAEAAKLWADINDPENAAATFLALGAELFDADASEAVKAALVEYYGNPAEVTDPTVTPPPPAPRDPEVQALIDRTNKQDYDAAVAAAVEKHKIPDEWADVVHPMIVSAEGNIEAAATALEQKLIAQGVIAAEPTPEVPKPPAIGEPTPVPVPTAKDYGGDIGAAIDDFVAEQRAAAPPVVGSV